MKLTSKFIQIIPKMEPVTFAAVAKLLGVPTVSDDKEPRQFTDVFEEVIQKFDAKDRSFKRELIRIIKKANSYKESDPNAGDT